MASPSKPTPSSASSAQALAPDAATLRVPEPAKAKLGLAVMVDEVGLASRRIQTVDRDGLEKLPSLSIVQSHNSFIDFPPGVFPPTSNPGTIAGPKPTRPLVDDEKADSISESDIESPAVLVDEFEIYSRFSAFKKIYMSLLMSYCGLLSSISSTAVLAALPEISSDYGVNGSIISISNAVCLVFMGIGPCFWGPLSQNFGRRWIVIAIAVTYTIGSVGTALSPNLGAFFFFRILTSFGALSFQVIGSTIVGDLYHPTERARGLGWYLIGPLVGPSIAPFMGSVVITYAPWRAIFWVQTVMCGIALVLAWFTLPETLHRPPPMRRLGLWVFAVPVGMIKMLRYPNLALVAATAGALVWNMYSLLTPIRYVLNPRFHLTSLQSGLFFLAPGVGNVIGAYVGTHWADATVARWTKKRNGLRIPEDRLRGGLFSMGMFMPACMLVYGWSVEKAVGGIPLPAVFMVLQAAASMLVFPTIDTYCLDVWQERAAEALGGNFMIKFWFGAAGSAVVVPAVESIGIGWFSTVSAGVLIAGAACAAVTASYGGLWRAERDVKLVARADAKAEARRASREEQERARTGNEV